jgi:hypothetical protein
MKNRSPHWFAVFMSLFLGSAALLGDVWLPAEAGSVQVTSLCTKGEKIVFSCPLKRSTKIVSLCSSTTFTKTQGYLQYRFGVPGKVELEYPKNRVGSQKAFHYSHYFRYQVDLTDISFSLDGNTYTVFHQFNGEEKPKISEFGLTVAPPNKKEVQYSCRGRAKADFGDLPDVFENEFPL